MKQTAATRWKSETARPPAPPNAASRPSPAPEAATATASARNATRKATRAAPSRFSRFEKGTTEGGGGFGARASRPAGGSAHEGAPGGGASAAPRGGSIRAAPPPHLRPRLELFPPVTRLPLRRWGDAASPTGVRPFDTAVERGHGGDEEADSSFLTEPKKEVSFSSFVREDGLVGLVGLLQLAWRTMKAGQSLIGEGDEAVGLMSPLRCDSNRHWSDACRIERAAWPRTHRAASSR